MQKNIDEQIIREFAEEFYTRGREANTGAYADQSIAHDGLETWALARAEEIGGPMPEDEISFRGMFAHEAAFWLWRVIALNTHCAWETLLTTPARTAEHFGDSPEWRVCWESGPYQWGIDLSCSESFQFDSGPRLTHVLSNAWFLEPYYSFDVNFVE